MCGRYTLVSKLQKVEERFQVQTEEPELYQPQVNIGPGRVGAVVTSDAPTKLQFFTFGMTPFWAKKPMYLFNARSEGDCNKDDDVHYSGAKGIVEKPAFRKPIRSQRCLIPADCFFEGSKQEKFSKPFAIYHQHEQPFAFAGVWDEWANRETGEIVHSFAIITSVANSVTKAVGHHRSPVILPREAEVTWLNQNTSLDEVTELLEPYPGDQLNAYPVSTDIKNPRNESNELLRPVGGYIKPECEFELLQELGLDKRAKAPQNQQQSLFE
jgi:putative SOS response-associated peptidase YedK